MKRESSVWKLSYLILGPASRQGDEKLVLRLTPLFSSTEIFSKGERFVRYEGECWEKRSLKDYFQRAEGNLVGKVNII